MSSASTVGLLPRLLPVTGSFLAPFVVFNTLLSLNVTRARLQSGQFLGDQVRPVAEKVKITDTSAQIDPILLGSRLHGNFLENVPFALAAATIVELNGGSRKALTYTLGALLLARISHVVGVTRGIQAFRASGYFGSLGILTALGSWAAYLAKGYWSL